MLKLVNPNAATSENVKILGKSHLSPIHRALHKARVKTIWKLDWKLILHHQSKFMRRFYWIEWKVQKWQYNDPSWCNKWHYLKLFTDCFCQWSKDYLFHRPTPNTMWKSENNKEHQQHKKKWWVTAMEQPSVIALYDWTQTPPYEGINALHCRGNVVSLSYPLAGFQKK